MSAVKVLEPIIFFSKLCGIAPFKFNGRKIEISNIWYKYSCCLLLCNTSGLIFLSIILFFDDSNSVFTNDFTLFLDLILCISSNAVTVATMLFNCKKISGILNEIIELEFTLQITKSWIKFLRNVYFLALSLIIFLILLISISDGIMSPFGSNESVSHGIFFMFCEIVLGIFICNYFGLLMLIAILYKELKRNLRRWIILINER